MTDKVQPTLPSGFRDYPPSEMAARNAMIEKIKTVFERYGFDPLDTPGMERLSTLTGNDPNFRMMLYGTQLRSSKQSTDPDQQTALRFDLTVPLARFVAANRELPKPFKRYQIGNVWRGERPQLGRYREFLQFDADIVGSDSPLADAEIIAIMVEVMQSLVGKKFTVRFNSRWILNGLAEYAGFDPALTPDVLRVIDKLSKIGPEAMMRELQKPVKRNAMVIEGEDQVESEFGLGLNDAIVKKIGRFVELKGTTDDVLGTLNDLFSGNELAERGIRDVRAIVKALRSMNVPEKNWKLDLSVARGLGYYTGTVYETYLDDLPNIGSVFSGGRYDDLVSRFMNDAIPAVGASVGVDRLFVALQELKQLDLTPTVTQALVTIMDEELSTEALAVAGELRAGDIRTQVWLGKLSFKEQLSFAAKQSIPVVVILGSDERRDGTVTIKDMRRRNQEVVKRNQLVSSVEKILRDTEIISRSE